MSVVLRISIVTLYLAASAPLPIGLLSPGAALAQSLRPAHSSVTVPTEATSISVEDARVVLRNATGNLVILKNATGNVPSGSGLLQGHINGIEVTDDKVLVFIYSHGDRRLTMPLSAVTGVRIEARDATHEGVCFNVDCTVAVYSMSPDRANAVANALVALTPPLEKPESQEERIAFEGQAKSYRDALVKPVPGEDVRRYQVQAQAAVSEAHFQEAAALYAKALDLAPWWPDGHFDRAIVLGETGGYRVAILEMKHYLQLIPDAKDGRVAQDKIYEWERKAGNGSGAN